MDRNKTAMNNFIAQPLRNADTIAAPVGTDVPQMVNIPQPAPTAEKAPKKQEFVGELLVASELDGQGVILLTVQGKEDETLTVSTSTGYWKKLGKLFPEGSIVKLSYEIRKKDETTYRDAQGVLKRHTADGNNLIGINRFSQAAWERELLKLNKDEDLATLGAVEVDRVGAVASYLSAYVKR